MEHKAIKVSGLYMAVIQVARMGDEDFYLLACVDPYWHYFVVGKTYLKSNEDFIEKKAFETFDEAKSYYLDLTLKNFQDYIFEVNRMEELKEYMA